MKKRPFLLITILLAAGGVLHYYWLFYALEIKIVQHSGIPFLQFSMVFWWIAALLTCSISLHRREPGRPWSLVLFAAITLTLGYIFFKHFYVYLPGDVDY
jgi:FtsH-binding integral membrane protein